MQSRFLSWLTALTVCLPVFSGHASEANPGGTEQDPNVLPYMESFENFSIDQTFLAADETYGNAFGWYALSGDDVFALILANDQPWQNVYPIAEATHTRMLSIQEGGVESRFNAQGNNSVFVDMMVRAVPSTEADAELQTADDTQVAVFVNADGLLTVWVDENGASEWVTLDHSEIAPMDWFRLTIDLDYTGTDNQFAIRLNGGDYLEGSDASGPWFKLVNQDNDYMTAVGFKGYTMVDDLVVKADDDPLAEPSSYRFDFDIPETLWKTFDNEVAVTLETEHLRLNGYDNVRVYYYKDAGDGDVTFTATDSENQTHTFVNEGYWGDSAGFPLPAAYSATTDMTVTFSEDGSYTIKYELLDVNDNNAVVAEGEAIVTVVTAAAYNQTTGTPYLTYDAALDAAEPGDLISTESGWLVGDGMSIQAAIDAAAEDDEIVVKDGVFEETININVAGLTVRSENGADSTTIKGTGSAASAATVRITADNVTLDGFTVDNEGAQEGCVSGGNHAASATIKNNVLVNSGRAVRGDFYGSFGAGLVIDSNVIDGVTRGVTNTEDIPSITVTDNQFKNIGANAVSFGSGVLTVTMTGNTFENVAGRHIANYEADSNFDLGNALDANTFDRAISVDDVATSIVQAIYATISQALADAAEGATLKMTVGTYPENVTVAKQVTIEGANAGVAAGVNPGNRGDESLIDGGFQITASGAVIDGVKIVTGYPSGAVRVGVAVTVSDVTVRNSIIDGVGVDPTVVAQSDGISTQGGNNNLTVTDSTIINNWRGVYLNPGSGHYFARNLIQANNGVGVGIGSDGQSNLTLEDNVIADNSFEGWGSSAVGENVVATGNTFSNNGVSIAHYGGEAIDANDNYWGSDDPDFGDLVSGDVNTDTWFADEEMTTRDSSLPVENIDQNTFFQTIQAAIDAAGGGDTITVSAGTYDENLTVNRADLTLEGPFAGAAGNAEGRGSDEAIVVGTVRFLAANITLDGFEVAPHRISGPTEFPQLVLQGWPHENHLWSGVSIKNNRIVVESTRNDAHGIWLESGGFTEDGEPDYGVTWTYQVEVSITDNYVHGGAIGVFGSIDSVVTGNVVENSLNAWGGLLIVANENITVENNQVSGSRNALPGNNVPVAPAGLLLEGNVNATVVENVFVDNGFGILRGDRRQFKWAHPVAWENLAYVIESSGCVIEDNVFAENDVQILDETRAQYMHDSVAVLNPLDLDIVLANNTYDRAVVVRGSPIKVPAIFSKIQDAITAAEAGDTVEVSTGVYKENLVVDVEDLVLTAVGAAVIEDVDEPEPWSGADGPNNPDRMPVVFVTAKGVTVENFEIRDYKVVKYVFSVVRVEADDVTLQGLEFNTQHGIDFEEIVVAKGTNVGIINNTINRATLPSASPAAIKIERDINPGDLVGDVLVEGNQITGGPIAVRLGVDATVTLRDNTIDQAWQEGIWVWAVDTPSTGSLVVEGNNVVNNNRIGEAGMSAFKVVTKPASINAEPLTFDMLAALQADNPEMDPIYLQWIKAVHNVNEDVFFDTIQAAIDAAAENDLIEVAPGLYEESVTLNKVGLTLQSSDGSGVTTLRGGVNTILANDVTLAGFTIDEAEVKIASGVTTPTVSGNVFTSSGLDFRGLTDYRYADEEDDVDAPTIDDLIALNQFANGNYVKRWHGTSGADGGWAILLNPATIGEGEFVEVEGTYTILAGETLKLYGTLSAGKLDMQDGSVLEVIGGRLELGTAGGDKHIIAGTFTIYNSFGSLYIDADTEFSGDALSLISDIHVKPGVTLTVSGSLTLDGSWVESTTEGDTYNILVTDTGILMMIRTEMSDAVMTLEGNGSVLRDNLLTDVSITVADGAENNAVYHNVFYGTTALVDINDPNTTTTVDSVDGWGNVSTLAETENNLTVSLTKTGLDATRTLDDGHLYVQPGDIVRIDLDVSELNKAIGGVEAMLGFNTDFFTTGSPSSLAGVEPWEWVFHDVFHADGVYGAIDTSIGLSFELPLEGTEEDGTVADIALGTHADAADGVTRFYFRTWPEGASSEAKTELSGYNLVDGDYELTPFTLNTGFITVDGTPPEIANFTATQMQDDGQQNDVLIDVFGPVYTHQGTVMLHVDAYDALAGIADHDVYVTLINQDAGASLTASLLETEPLTVGEETWTRYAYTVDVLDTTPNGVYDVEVVVMDRSGNFSEVLSGTIEVDKNQVEVTVELQGAHAGPFDRLVTFKATDTQGTVIATWHRLMTFENRFASDKLVEVPDDMAQLSAKTHGYLRRRVAAALDADKQLSVSFSGDDMLLGGDISGDNFVNMTDFNRLRFHWLSEDNPETDITGSGSTGLHDLQLIQWNWYATGDPE